MTIDKNQITKVVKSVVEEINKSLTGDKLDFDANSILLGEEGLLDSLSALNFFVLLEESISDNFGQRVSFIDETLLGQPEGKLDNIDNLCLFLSETLG